jgi:hypothetical protein
MFAIEIPYCTAVSARAETVGRPTPMPSAKAIGIEFQPRIN